MANSVKFSIPEREIGNIGVTFVRKKNGSKLPGNSTRSLRSGIGCGQSPSLLRW